MTKHRPGLHALQITAVYVLVGLAWILFSDRLILWWTDDPKFISRLQTFKGIGFVLLTALGLFALVRIRLGTEVRKAESVHALTESELKRERNLLEQIADTTPVGIMVFDTSGALIFVNGWAERMLGTTEAALRQQADPWAHWRLTDEQGETLPSEQLAYRRVLKEGAPIFGTLYRLEPPGQERVLVSCDAAPLFDNEGRIQGVVSAFQDVTAQRRNERQIRRLNRVYNVLIKISQLIQRTRDPETLLREACHIAVAEGGFRMAWVGKADPDTREVRPLAVAGQDQGYTSQLSLRLDDSMAGQGPTLRALGEGRHIACNDIANAPEYEPWREEALARGYRSSAAFPLLTGRRVWGTLNLYAAVPDFFNAEEVQLIKQLAADLSLALTLQSQARKRLRAEQRLRQSEARYRSLFEELSTSVLLLDPENRIVEDANPAACRWYGWDRERVAGTPVTSFIATPEEQVREAMKACLSGARNYFLSEHYDATGERRHVEIYSSVVRVGEKNLIYAVVHDVTTRHQAEEKLRLNSAVVDSIRDSVMVMDLSRRIISVNPAFCAITGYTDSEVLGRTPEFLRADSKDDRLYESIWQQVESQGYWQGEVRSRRRDGSVFPGLLSLSAVKNEKMEITHYVSVITDLSSLKESEERFEHLVHYDPLTNLPNRALAQSRLEHSIEQAKRHRRRLAVLFMDLDGFKTINDSLGHKVGDELLVAFAERLNRQVRREDTLARFGGDKFMLVLEAVEEPQRAAVVARHIHTALQNPFQLPSGHQVFVGASLGISIFPDDGDSASALMRNAETAMYEAKKIGRNQFCYYTGDMNADARAVLELEAALRQALMRRELLLFYQPKVELEHGHVAGVEALIRWRRPEQGMVPPGDFIPLAEQTGLIVPIGTWVIEEACRQIRAWQDQPFGPLRVAVNVSARQFRSGDLVSVVQKALADTAIDPALLELELTESMLMERTDEAIQYLTELKKLGVRIALDDFGTGYSSLAYLSRFPIDALKIDKSFVMRLLEDPNADTITASIIDLAHRMGLAVVAEGVETRTQLEYLTFHGCDEMQGFLFSRPLPLAELEELARSGEGLAVESAG